jgi:PEP-CTERM motif
MKRSLLFLSSVIVGGTASLGVAQAAPSLTLWGNNASVSDVVESFDPTTGAVINQFSLPSLDGSGNGRGVVIVGNTGFFTQAGSGKIGEFNATTGAFLGSIQTPLTSFASITYDGTDFWVGDYSGNSNAYRIDMSGNVVKTISLANNGGFADGLNYYLDNGQGRLISNRGDAAGGEYDVYDTNGNLITSALLNDTSPGSGTGVAFNGVDFYVSNIFSNSVNVYDASGNFIQTIILGNPLPNTGTGERLIEGLSFNYQQTLGTPEPSTWAMLMVGFAGLGYAGFRRGAKARSAFA